MEQVNHRIKVLMLLPDFPDDIHHIRGGVHAAVLNLLEGFSMIESLELFVLAFTKNKNKRKFIPYSSHIYIHVIWEGPFSHHMLNYASYTMWSVNRMIKLLKPHLIHYQVGNGFLLTSLTIPTHIPIIQTIHGMPMMEAKIKKTIQGKLNGLVHHLMNRILYPKNIIHLSSFSQQLHQNLTYQRSVIIPNALKMAYADLPISNTFNYHLLFIGHLDRNKNLLFLLGLLKRLNVKNKRYQLQVAGGVTNKPYYEEIKQHIQKLDLQDQVIFNGWCDEIKKRELMRNADFLLVPSFHESYPMVILEGMSAGLIVLANQTGGIPEIIKDGENGFLFDIQNMQSCIQILEKLENNLTLMHDLRKRAKKFAQKKYHPYPIAKDTFSFYQKTLNNDSVYS